MEEVGEGVRWGGYGGVRWWEVEGDGGHGCCRD